MYDVTRICSLFVANPQVEDAKDTVMTLSETVWSKVVGADCVVVAVVSSRWGGMFFLLLFQTTNAAPIAMITTTTNPTRALVLIYIVYRRADKEAITK